MKVALLAKLEKRSTTTSKKFDDDAMLANYNVIAIFLVYGQFGTVR